MKPLISIVFTAVFALVAASDSLAAQSQAPAPAQVASPAAASPTGEPSKSQVTRVPQLFTPNHVGAQ
ncbi:MAG: hypothetical protein KJ614_17610 [Gammaproteobacteria bacterium]|uniref:hypothetical protein n=1 Tax=Rhodoferax sp. TaxID=50421 RepID=UPI0018067539|nr:hypothetical protein [Rhodoferax sp.]MBU3900706.1 hypothetical protein [Gammaproteobacteria bacterium]MBA3056896.1 hypothetical protein [Rhodoferax sp.]MBU3997216.1 hypothetical protein [Gammaproteobacteria bacterium]MBU4079457.1 hypothetical protein [Gammaproteobacteria bacterium]MBU4115112.1 hypothetical protein [Gammaproteobacteria bacterium]